MPEQKLIEQAPQSAEPTLMAAGSSSSSWAGSAAAAAGDASGKTLLELPNDCLLATLQSTGLTALELCRLEQTCKAIRAIIDEQVWMTVFLQHRRRNALRDPESWKQEYARRDSWSRSWRQLITGAHMPSAGMRLGGHANKLRRFALKMMTGAQSSPPSLYATHVVSASRAARNEPGVFATISAAIAKARPFDVVLIHPGMYCERLRLDKPIELIGAGGLGGAVLTAFDGPTIEVNGRVACRIAGLSLQQRAQNDGGAMSGAVLVKGGAMLILEESVVTSETGHCVVLQGADSCGYILHNQIHQGKGVGLLVCDHAKGVIEDNTISSNGRAGIAILSGGDPLVCANRIYDGMDSGVLISERGRGRVEDNDIYGNRRAGVAILKEGAPLVKRNRIHDGRDSGVLVCENGKGSVVDNDIFANQMAGVAIGRGGASRVTGNVIRDGNGGSLCLSAHSRGLISANVIHHHARAAMQVPEGLLPEVKEHNLIRYSGGAEPDGSCDPGGLMPAAMEIAACAGARVAVGGG